jgi:hypothetical protein
MNVAAYFGWRQAILCWAVAVVLSGCETVSDVAADMRDRVAARNEGRTKMFAAGDRATFEAVRAAAGTMGYRILRAGAAQGELEAVNTLGTEGSLRSSRQIAMKVRVRAVDERTSEVNVRLTEIIETDSADRAGLATETPLRDTPQYEVFFRAVQRAIEAQKAPNSGLP